MFGPFRPILSPLWAENPVSETRAEVSEKRATTPGKIFEQSFPIFSDDFFFRPFPTEGFFFSHTPAGVCGKKGPSCWKKVGNKSSKNVGKAGSNNLAALLAFSRKLLPESRKPGFRPRGGLKCAEMGRNVFFLNREKIGDHWPFNGL